MLRAGSLMFRLRPTVATAFVLALASPTFAASLVWKGSPSTTWDHLSANWLNGGSPSAFTDGDNVSFTDTAASGNVSLSGTLAPNSILVNATRNYTFSGSGLLAGFPQLAKDGAGTLTISNLNTGFTGSLEIFGGQVIVSAGASLPVSAISVSPGASLFVASTGSIGFPYIILNGNASFNSSTTLDSLSGEGTIGLPGTLTLTNTNTFGGVITDRSGPASLAIAGGIVTLTGQSTFTGTTSINAGTLRIGNGGTTGSIPDGLPITNNGALIFNRSDAITINSVITGTGRIQQGPGTLTLTANHTYTGQTGVTTNATLIIGNGSTSGSLATSLINNNGFVTFNRSDLVTATYALYGLGTYTKSGSGTLILTGTSSFFNGVMNITAGTLQVGNGGSTGDLGSASVTNNAVLAFNRANPIILANVISGAGQVVQLGDGTLILTAANSYAGGTTISAGILQIGNNTAGGSPGSGAILNNSALAFSRSASATFNNAISGAGSIRHLRANTLTLSGTLNYSGTTQIDVGELFINTAGSPAIGAVSGDGALRTSGATDLTTDAITVANLTINKSLSIRPNGNSTSKVNALLLAGTFNSWSATLDLTDNPFILQTQGAQTKTAAIATLQNQIASGKTGPGITSSTVALDPTHLTLALADNADLHYTSFRGQPTDDNALIIVQATFGDATLDNKVDALDLNLLAAHWQQQQNALWSAGDFTGDGKVDALDLNLLAANWQFTSSLTAALAQLPFNDYQLQVPANVPELTSMALLLPTTLLLTRRPSKPRAAPVNL